MFTCARSIRNLCTWPNLFISERKCRASLIATRTAWKPASGLPASDCERPKFFNLSSIHFFLSISVRVPRCLAGDFLRAFHVLLLYFWISPAPEYGFQKIMASFKQMTSNIARGRCSHIRRSYIFWKPTSVVIILRWIDGRLATRSHQPRSWTS